MRRPRSKLEVSTFPFLAVLLCVMGSLLLLLFIMDRRAKIAAKYRVTEELQARKERTKAEEEARQAEWEKAKNALHQTLLAEQEQLAAEAKGLEQNLSDATRNLTLVQARHVGLEQNIKAEGDRIGAIQLEIESRRADIKEAAKKETMTKAELLEAARELAELERAFRQLKSLKASEYQTYSVVPYRGKRGDSRPPIYVECVRDGVIFHPEQKTLSGLFLTPDSLREEVERRSGPLAMQRAIDNSKPPTDEQKGPYILFLVRPDGIGNYYRAQGVLRGYQLDFGYELVEETWVLDFSGDSRAKAGASKPGIPDLRVEPIVVPLPPPLFAGSGLVQPGEVIVPPGGIQPPSITQVNPPVGVGNRPPTITPVNPAVGIGSAGPPPLVTPPVGFGPPSFPSQPGGKEQSSGPSFVPIAKAPPLFPSGSNTEHGGSANPSNPGGGTPGQQPPSGTPGKGQASGDGTGGNRLPTGLGSPGNGSPGHGATGDPQGDSSGPSIRPLPTFGSDTDKKPTPAPPLSRLLGNKDFIITVDCHGDYVTITPGSLTYRWTASNLKETDDAIVQSVKNLIARRQASVQPGEPPYRPLIRLCVHADGRNTLYRAYPLLDRVGVTMTRENVSD
jgi:hypothetical protein